MNELNINNLKVIDKISDPYPIIIYSNLLDEPQIHELEKCLSTKEPTFDKTVMGNRKTLLKGTDKIMKFLKTKILNFERMNMQKLLMPAFFPRIQGPQ